MLYNMNGLYNVVNLALRSCDVDNLGPVALYYHRTPESPLPGSILGLTWRLAIIRIQQVDLILTSTIMKIGVSYGVSQNYGF